MNSRSIALGAALFAIGCGAKSIGLVAADGGAETVVESPAAPPPVVNNTAAADYLGVILSSEAVELAPRTDGRLESVRKKIGDAVRRGEVVAELDVRALKSELNVAEAGLADASQRYNRRAPLARGNAISREELDNSKVQVMEKRARVDALRQAIGEAQVKSPFDGVVAARYADPGSMVGPGKPIARVITEKDPRVRFAVPEGEIGDVVVGSHLRLEVKTLNVTLAGVVESVAPEVDSAARMYFVEGKVATPKQWKGRLSSGLVARVQTVRGADKETVVTPQ